MKHILFIDTLCSTPYDLQTLSTSALGGTEASVVRIAEKLSEKAAVTVVQAGREHTSLTSHVTYCPVLHGLLDEEWDAVIAVRDPRRALELKELLPNTPVWLWLHDLVTANFLKYMQPMSDNDIGVIAVSDFHRNQLLEICKLDPYLPRLPRFERIYNPIDDDLIADNTPVDRNKLVFMSSPHKGLANTVRALAVARKRNPKFELWVSDPGYAGWSSIGPDTPHVRQLGALSHTENMQQMRGALALFYLNHSQPETFGLAIAEANALGIPVLTHPFGAAPEVVCSQEELVNTHDFEAVTNRLMQWYDGQRPIVAGKDSFRLSHVIKQWKNLLGISE